MNVADSELVEAILISEGYKKSIDINSADAIFVNTCAIREQAEEKLHRKEEELRKKQKKRIYTANSAKYTARVENTQNEVTEVRKIVTPKITAEPDTPYTVTKPDIQAPIITAPIITLGD